MHGFVYLPVIAALIFTLSLFSIPDALATGGTISDGPSCVAVGGTWNGVSTCTVTSLTINSGQTLTINSGIQLINLGTITNAGTISINSNGYIYNNKGTISNSGTITNNNGGNLENEGFDLNTGGTINNSGTIINFGRIDNDDNGNINNTSSGTIINKSTGAIVNFTGNITNNFGGTIYNFGIIQNVTTLTNSGTIYNYGTINNNGTITNHGVIRNTGGISNQGTIDNPAIIFNTGTFTNSGTFANTGSFDNSGSIYNNVGIILNSGSISNNSGGLISNYSGGTITNYSGGDITNNLGGVITNISGSVITNNVGGVITNYSAIYNHINATLNNSGLITNSGTISNDGIIINNKVGGISNSGTIDNTFGIISNPGNIFNQCGGVYTGTPPADGNPIRITVCPTISINDISLAEGNSGTKNFNFIVTRAGDTTSTSSVNYTTSDGTATISNSDYVSKSGTLLFTAGQTTKTVTISVNGDTALEPNETFNVNLSSCVGCTITDNQGVGTILNDDSSTLFPIIVMNDTTVSSMSLISSPRPFIGEFASPTSTLIGKQIDSITLKLQKVGAPTGLAQVGIFDINRNVVKQFGTIDVSTISTTVTDYEFKLLSTDPLYAIASGDRIGFKYTGGSATAGVNVTPDRNAADPFDGANSYRVRYETSWITSTTEDMYMILTQTHGATISLSDISINDLSLTEGNSGTKNFNFTVTRTDNTTGISSVNYTTSDGTATISNSDYISKTGTLVFTAGQTTKTVTISVNGDTAVEPSETFNVNLSSCVGCTIVDNQGIGTILNDDASPPPTNISINDLSLTEGNSGTKNFNFTVTRTDNTTGISSVNYTTSDGTATISNSDYVSKSGTLLFTAGQTTKTVTISVNGDTAVEPSETFNVNLSSCVGCTITDNQGVGTILNDDIPPPPTNEIDIAVDAGSSPSADCVAVNNCFTPNPLHVNPGTIVTWNNTDTVSQTVTSGKSSDNNTGSLFDSGLFSHNHVFQFIFTTTGTYDYFSSVHPWMTGQVIVDVVPTTCSPPILGDWIIASSCTLTSTSIAPANVIVNNGTVLTIQNGTSLEIEFENKYLLVKSGGGVLIKAGGSISSPTRVTIVPFAYTTPGTCSPTNCFNPSIIAIKTGTSVIWTNNDFVIHTVTSGLDADIDSGSLFNSTNISPGGTFTYTFSNVGSFNYHCEIHPWLIGHVNVS